MTFAGFHYGTTRLNEAVKLIYCLGGNLDENKNGQHERNLLLSIPVARTRFELVSPP